MNVIKIEEIIYASTEKSLVTGSAGFGIRTYSEGLQPNEAEDIMSKASISYSVPIDKAVDKAQLQANPAIVEQFPPIFTYRQVTTNSGRQVWTLSRSVYVGIDYGYFCDNKFAERAGANYLTDMLVFDQRPDVRMMRAVAYGNLFKPEKRDASADNPEWRQLLTGEPKMLGSRQVDLDRLDFNFATPWQEDFYWLTIALMQVAKNRQTGTGKTKIIFKAPDAATTRLVASMGLLPDKLAGGICFQTNYTRGNGVPEGYDMVVVGEQNTEPFYDEEFITIDELREHKRINIEQNFLFTKLKEYWGNEEMTGRIIDLWLGIDHRTAPNYAFAFQMMMLSDTSEPVAMDDIDADFIGNLAGVSGEAADKVWRKVNDTLNGALESDLDEEYAGRVVDAFDHILIVKGKVPARLDISDKSRQQLIEAMFREEEPQFDNIIAADGNVQYLDITLDLIGTDMRVNVGMRNFFKALHEIEIPEVWRKAIDMKMEDQQVFIDQFDTVVGEIILAERFSEAEKLQLIRAFYPDSAWLVKQNLEEPYAAANDTLTRLITPLALNNIRIKVSDMFRSMQQPTIEAINEIRNGRFRPDAQLDTRLMHMAQLVEGDENVTYVDSEMLQAAKRWKLPMPFYNLLLRKWVETVQKTDEIIRVISVPAFTTTETAIVIDTLWTCLKPTMPGDTRRADAVLSIIDMPRWEKRDLEEILARLKQKDCVDFITKEKSFVKDMMRKVTSIFKGFRK